MVLAGKELQARYAPAANSTNTKRQDNPDTFTYHLATQVDKLRDAGIRGQGIKIAVIDTGVSRPMSKRGLVGPANQLASQVDYLHPNLGGCFGPGCLVSFGTDLVGYEFGGADGDIPVPDPDPMDDCVGHGTHVAGIIAASPDNAYGVVGAATDVILGAYKVFGCGQPNSAPDDVLIKAYGMAYEDGSNIITASIGSSHGWEETAWGVVVGRIVEAGVPCILSQGNSGDMGMFYPSTAANTRDALAVGSTDPDYIPVFAAEASYDAGSGAVAFTFGTVGSFNRWADLPLWSPLQLDPTAPDDGCDGYPDDTPDLSNYIVLIHRGSCTFKQKGVGCISKGSHLRRALQQPGRPHQPHGRSPGTGGYRDGEQGTRRELDLLPTGGIPSDTDHVNGNARTHAVG